MPLRDHFRPMHRWEGLHSAWATMIAMTLNRVLPPRYVAEPGVHWGTSIEVDVGFFDRETHDAGGIALEQWAPPTLAVETELPGQDAFEVMIRDNGTLVAVVELVSPGNKDRTESRRAFATKVNALLEGRVSVTIVDIVTDSRWNLYRDILRDLNPDTRTGIEGGLYAVAIRPVKRHEHWTIEAWEFPLAIGHPLPTVPLWLAENLVVPLDLEATYEETRRNLRIY